MAMMAIACACGTSAPAHVPQEPPETDVSVVRSGGLHVAVHTRFVQHGVGTGLLFRITNEGERAVLVDLRDVDRVIRAGAAGALHMPLSDAQRGELAESSALTPVRPGETALYGVAFDRTHCFSMQTAVLGGVLVALDGDRAIELVADGAEVEIPCLSHVAPFPAEASWVDAHAPFAAAAPSASDYAADLPELVRAASVATSADVSLLPFSYDPRPIERWRYDACVALGRCAVRVVAQPPGSIARPAVGMAPPGVAAFCESRGLRALSSEETALVADPARPLLESDVMDVVLAGFRCARTERATPP